MKIRSILTWFSIYLASRQFYQIFDRVCFMTGEEATDNELDLLLDFLFGKIEFNPEDYNSLLLLKDSTFFLVFSLAARIVNIRLTEFDLIAVHNPKDEVKFLTNDELNKLEKINKNIFDNYRETKDKIYSEQCPITLMFHAEFAHQNAKMVAIEYFSAGTNRENLKPSHTFIYDYEALKKWIGDKSPCLLPNKIEINTNNCLIKNILLNEEMTNYEPLVTLIKEVRNKLNDEFNSHSFFQVKQNKTEGQNQQNVLTQRFS